jgi:O-antigen/teichoic acid export membrane protein
VFKDRIVANNTGKSILVAQYAYFIIPFTLTTLLFNFFEGLHRVMYNAVIGLFVKEFLFRVLNLLLILAYAWFTFSFGLFLNLYYVIFSMPPLILIIALARTQQFRLKPQFGFIGKDLRREIAGVSFFGVISGLGTVAVSSIDKIMINHFIDLEATGIYSIAFLFGTIITLPSRPLTKIASTILAESWKKNDLENIRMIYTKSSLNQFIFGGLIFLMLWLNVDLVFMLLREEYEAGRWVILFMAISGVLVMAGGLNGFIVSSSKYYRFQAYFVLILLVAVVLTNVLFIPWLGITGAAIASLISTLIFNLVRIIFLWRRFRMQPFTSRFLVVLGLLLLTLLVGHLFQGIGNWILRTALISFAVLILYLVPVFALGLSEDLTRSLWAMYRKIRGQKG